MPSSIGTSLRELLHDFFYGFRTGEARAKAEALSEIYDRAAAAGASPEDLSKITSNFPRIADELLGPSQPGGDPHSQPQPPGELPPPPEPKQLPPG